jgi:hypothetical protein
VCVVVVGIVWVVRCVVCCVTATECVADDECVVTGAGCGAGAGAGAEAGAVWVVVGEKAAEVIVAAAVDACAAAALWCLRACRL